MRGHDASGPRVGCIRTRWLWSISPAKILVWLSRNAGFSCPGFPGFSSFMSGGNLNGHHQEWLGSTTMNCHGVAAFDFATVSSCDQLVVGPTHARVGTLDLLMTDVPDLVWVAVVAPIGNSDHSTMLEVISMAQSVPNLFVCRKAFLKHQVNWNTVCGAIQELPWHNIWLSDNPAEVLNEHLSLLVGCCVPTKVIREQNKDKPWFAMQACF